MGSQLRWLERTPDKREVDGSIPFEPTTSLKDQKEKYIENYIEKNKGKLAYQMKKSSMEAIKPKMQTKSRKIQTKNKVKLQRAQGECLGTKSRRRT